MKTVQIMVIFSVKTHTLQLPVKVLGAVKILKSSPKKSLSTMIPILVCPSILMMSSKVITSSSYLKTVIPMLMDLLKSVNSNNVSSNVKTNGDLNTVMKNSDMPIVHVKKKFVKENGTVLMFSKSLVNTWMPMIPIVMVKSISETVLNLNI
jgi:hypothetical protein